jgi:Flp pilus assembly protein TadG
MTRRAGLREDTGTLTLSTVIVVPTIIFLLALVILGGRIARANGAVEAAAHEAARAASVSRALADAETAARTTADVSLASAGVDCTSVVLSTDLAALTAPAGEIGQVSVTVTCTVPLADLGPLGEPDRTITYTAVSSVDPYRSRG